MTNNETSKVPSGMKETECCLPHMRGWGLARLHPFLYVLLSESLPLWYKYQPGTADQRHFTKNSAQRVCAF